MKIYKKYLFKYLIKYFILTLFITTIIIWITRTIRYIDYITDYGLSLKNFLTIAISILPALILFTIPISSFISTIFVYNKLIKNNELIILQNSGLKKSNFLFPVILMSFFVMMLSYSVTLYFSQLGNIKFEETKLLVKNNVTKVLLNNVNFNNFQNITFYAKDNRNNLLNSFFIYIKSKDNNLDKIIYAKTGQIINNYIILNDGNIQEFIIGDNELRTLYFDKYTIDISEYYNTIPSTKFDLDLLFLPELIKIENKTTEIKSEIFDRLLTPLLSLTLSLLACLLTLNLTFSRNENSIGIIKVYIVCLTNFALYSYFIKTSKKNIISIYVCIVLLLLPLFIILYSFIKDIINKNKLLITKSIKNDNI